MGSMLLVIVVAVLATIWVRNTRAARQRWLTRLNLPGVWECESDAGTSVLEFSGGLAAGRWVEQDPAGEQRGEWVLHGDAIEFRSGDAVSHCELRVFDDGSLGIHGSGRERRIYRRRANNVVPLRAVR
jgi:hypothetical protein